MCRRPSVRVETFALKHMRHELHAHAARLEQTFNVSCRVPAPLHILQCKRLFQTCVLACVHARTHVFQGLALAQSEGLRPSVLRQGSGASKSYAVRPLRGPTGHAPCHPKRETPYYIFLSNHLSHLSLIYHTIYHYATALETSI